MGRFEWWYSHSFTTTGCAKCHQIGIITFDTAPFDISLNISTSSGRGRMGIPPFDSSRRAGSNGGIFGLLRPLDLNGIWVGIWDWDGNGIWDLGWDGMGWAGMGWDFKWFASIYIPKN